MSAYDCSCALQMSSVCLCTIYQNKSHCQVSWLHSAGFFGLILYILMEFYEISSFSLTRSLLLGEKHACVEVFILLGLTLLRYHVPAGNLFPDCALISVRLRSKHLSADLKDDTECKREAHGELQLRRRPSGRPSVATEELDFG